jgi:predicted nucleic acid-binding protein
MERRKQRGLLLTRAALDGHIELVTLTPVIAEWWRGRSDRRETILKAVHVFPLPIDVAQVAGDVLARMQSAGAALAIDAMVVAFAALRGGGVVYTSDIGDLMKLQISFPSVRLLSV